MQTAYPVKPSDGKLGTFYDSTQWNMSRSGVAYLEEIPFGRAIVFAPNTTPAQSKFKLPETADEVSGGVFVAGCDVTKVEGKYSVKDSLYWMIMGIIWVETEEAVTLDKIEDVYVRYAGVRGEQTFTLDADLVVDNEISALFNGHEVSQTWDTDHDTTMAAFVDKIKVLPFINDAVLTAPDNRIITITVEMDETLAITDEEVTGGVSQANIVIAETVVPVSTENRGKFRCSAATGCAQLQGGAMWWDVHASGMAPLYIMPGNGGGGGEEEVQQ